MKNKTLVIGDIHGALKALQQLIGMLELRETDRLIFLGDYVDGWPESAQVIDYLMELDTRYACTFIKGNHDAWCQDWLAGMPASDTWLQHGGRATVDSYKGMDDSRKREHLDFFNRLKNYYVDEDNRLFIHAGFASMHGPAQEPYSSNYSWDRTLWEMARTIDPRISKESKLYPKRLLIYKEIFIGHTPTIYYDVAVPMQGSSVWNVDTGAAFYGKLSAMDIDSKQYWQSDVVQQLYPNVKGRNK